MLKHILELLLEDANVDALVFGLPTSQFSERTAEQLVELVSEAKKPVLTFWIGRTVVGPAIERLRESRVPVFEQPAACFRALGALIRRGEFEARRQAELGGGCPVNERRKAEALEVLDGASGALSEYDSKRLLRLYGIMSPPEKVVASPTEAASAAAEMGFPVAVKAHGRELNHKTELGGVCLNVESEGGTEEAFTAVTVAGGTQDALVAKMIPPGVEMILGIVRDADVGLMLMVGAGGTLVEVLDDAAGAITPLLPHEPKELVSRLRCERLLDGVRGHPPVDREALVEAITGLSTLAAEIGDVIEQIDINPVIVNSNGAWAADALVVTRDTVRQAH